MADAETLAAQQPASPNGTTFGDGSGGDWPAKASATVVRYVGVVRDKTTGPALVASRNLVYIVPIGLISLVLAVLVLVVAVRTLVVVTAYVPGVELGEPWLAYFILGAIFLLAGALLWRKKER
jgi:hypothetical protein